MSSPERLPPSARVRVTGPPRRTRRPVARTTEVDSQSRLGGVLLGSLLREQARLALTVLTALAVTVGALPLLYLLAPGLARVHVLGVPLTWWVPGVVAYPVLLALAWRYVVLAERTEDDWSELMDEVLDAPEES